MDRQLVLAIVVGVVAVAGVLSTLVLVGDEAALLAAAVALATVLGLVRSGVIQLDPVETEDDEDQPVDAGTPDALGAEGLPAWEALPTWGAPEPGPEPEPAPRDEAEADPVPAHVATQTLEPPPAPIDETVRSEDDILAASKATELSIAETEGDSELAKLLSKVQDRLAAYE